MSNGRLVACKIQESTFSEDTTFVPDEGAASF